MQAKKTLSERIKSFGKLTSLSTMISEDEEMNYLNDKAATFNRKFLVGIPRTRHESKQIKVELGETMYQTPKQKMLERKLAILNDVIANGISHESAAQKN